MRLSVTIISVILAAGHTAGLNARNLPAQLPETVSRGIVKSIIDGDTLVLQNGSEVRLVGIQAPKLPLGRKNFPVWPLAPESKGLLSKLTMEKPIKLRYGGRKIDRHRRLLAHLYLLDGRWIQGELLKAGMARVYSFSDNRTRVPAMLKIEAAARAAKRGIWQNAYYRIRSNREAGRFIGTFQLIQGKVLKTAVVRKRAYLNFGQNWRNDFTITMSPRMMRRFWKKGPTIKSYEGKTVRVRGWLKRFNGPMIEATHPEQIEILE